MITNNSAFKCETSYNLRFDVTQCWTNGTVALRCVERKIRYKISFIKLYTSDTNTEGIISEN